MTDWPSFVRLRIELEILFDRKVNIKKKKK
jgi:hypothetical protein